MRPLIGLTTYAEPARYGSNEKFAAVLPMAYVRAVHSSGGRAVLVTEDDPGTDVLGALDGLIITGGADVSPERYGEAAGPRTVTRPTRDEAEMLLLRAALEADMPVLAICRGMQLMAVACGGRLYQHLPDVLGHERHRPSDGSGSGAHEVRFAPGSLCYRLLGGSVAVNSWHHQGVASVGSLTPTGWVPGEMVDGAELVEAIEDQTKRFAVGVQWHPEESDDWRLFEALVDAIRA